MSREKMISFLNSIGITNVEDFDLSFQYAKRNEKNHEQVDMIIEKDTPWKYEILRQFQDGLNRITYPYTIKFLYKEKPTIDNVIELFKAWHLSIYRVPLNLNVEGNTDSLKITYKNEDEQKKFALVLNDFRYFLTFLNYEISIDEVIETNLNDDEDFIELEAEFENCLQDNENTEIVEKKEEAEAKTTNVEESNSEVSKIKDEKQELTEMVEDFYLELMKKNLELMKKEREKERLYRRGGYVFIDSIDNIDRNSDHVDFSGKVFSVEKKEFAGKMKVIVGVFDINGGAIFVNMNRNARFNNDVIERLVWGVNIRVRGAAYYSEYDKGVVIKGHMIDLLPPDEIVPEEGPTRVELHLHSKMSAMDGVSDMQDYCSYAKALGHKCISITDHAVVQGYPDAQKAAKDSGLKMLYGVEFYMIDDNLKYILNPSDISLSNATYVVLDTETTGLSAKYNRIIEFGAVRVEHGLVRDSFDLLINPGSPIPEKITEITGITDAQVANQPLIKDALPKIISFIGDAILVTHNAEFDIAFLNEELKRNGYPELKNPVIDTLALSRFLFPDSKRHNLGSLCKNMEIRYDEDDAHRADYDARVLNDVWQPILVRLQKDNENLRHCDLANLETSKTLFKHIRPSHVIAFAKNKDGLKALYKLVSLSHVDYLADVPKIPRNEIEKYRENLLIGSACFNGDVFQTARYYNNDRLMKVMSFYDYIEIQPLENYSWFVGMNECTQEEILNFVNDIVSAADELHIPVCATGDCHYATKDKKTFRDVYIFGKLLGNATHPLNPHKRDKLKDFENPNQYYLSTKEMLEAMSFLGEEKAYEVTVVNTNNIADQCDLLVPVPNDHLYTPTIENCDNILREMCFNKAHELYGDVLPEFIENRLNKELNGIINNGYAVIYYIAHKIIKKANEDGFVVGSRGSVGSSFVATMSNITEVNPLPPHYRCPKCKHLEWTSETLPNIKSGYDLPEKKCPICGENMVHDGQNIPFETFLGFDANKTPDIDLNFPRDYQSKAHDYTKVLLGADNVYRAGTIETVATKTAFGYAKGYIERKFMKQGMSEDAAKAAANDYSKAKIGYLASGCVDVKRTTGQHPGGIVVIPTNNDVYDFTPVQYPADDIDANWKTTHFDFHSIHDTILKLDLLGHLDPMALRMMCNLTNIDIKNIPLNDEKVISLFSSPDALGMSEDYDKATTGALGIPEFGTEFVRGILDMTKPKSFSDLVIISGISHGTNVWQGNAEKHIKNGVATLQEVIGCRDDIMTYLISKGLPSITSFKIMEDVRKGKGLKPEYEEIMKANKVPDYYIESCNLIEYMFPKGHAVAYVTMAIRVGYFKVYYPLEFYATFFTTRSKQYDIGPMIKGKEAVIARLKELESKNDKLSNKESEQVKTLHIVLEMMQRGYKFANISLEKSEADKFVIDYENKCLIPPFDTIDQLGDSAAQSVVDARKDGPFTSKENLARRTKLSQTNIKALSELGALGCMPDQDQVLLFDF